MDQCVTYEALYSSETFNGLILTRYDAGEMRAGHLPFRPNAAGAALKPAAHPAPGRGERVPAASPTHPRPGRHPLVCAATRRPWLRRGFPARCCSSAKSGRLADGAAAAAGLIAEGSLSGRGSGQTYPARAARRPARPPPVSRLARPRSCEAQRTNDVARAR